MREQGETPSLALRQFKLFPSLFLSNDRYRISINRARFIVRYKCEDKRREPSYPVRVQIAMVEVCIEAGCNSRQAVSRKRINSASDS